MSADKRTWMAFVTLAVVWGTSFLFIKIGLRTLGPFTLVSLRLLIGFLGLVVVMVVTGQWFPKTWSIWRHLAFLGAVNTAVPFVLITWAESGPDGVDSAVAAVLNSTVPLFSIVIAGVILKMETVTVGKVTGLLVGFLGVMLMLSRGLVGETGSLSAHLAVITAAFCYAIASIYARRFLKSVRPVVVAAGQLLIADAIVWILALIFEDLSQQSMLAETLFSLLWLGLLGSCLAYILYFNILAKWGPTRTTLVTYLLPIVGVTAGVIFLGEALDLRLVVGGLMILSGIALVNWRPASRVAQTT